MCEDNNAVLLVELRIINSEKGGLIYGRQLQGISRRKLAKKVRDSVTWKVCKQFRFYGFIHDLDLAIDFSSIYCGSKAQLSMLEASDLLQLKVLCAMPVVSYSGQLR